MKIGIIGLGNIGTALYKGMKKANFEQKLINVCDKSLDEDAKKLFRNNQLIEKPREIIKKVDILFLCIRTEQVYEFLRKNNSLFTDKHIIVFMSAGIKLSIILKILKPTHRQNVIRVVSNINLASCNAYTFVYKSKKADLSVFEQVMSIFNNLGVAESVHSEDKLDMYSLLSGCVPALLGLFLESIIDSGIEVGIKNRNASKIVKYITSSSIKTMEQEKINSHELLRRASTPGGLVAKALDEISKTQFKNVINSWLPKIFYSIKNEKE